MAGNLVSMECILHDVLLQIGKLFVLLYQNRNNYIDYADASFTLIIMGPSIFLSLSLSLCLSLSVSLSLSLSLHLSLHYFDI